MWHMDIGSLSRLLPACGSAVMPSIIAPLVMQVENMTNKHHVYMTKDGRISLAGLNKAKSEYLAKAIDDSVRNC